MSSPTLCLALLLVHLVTSSSPAVCDASEPTSAACAAEILPGGRCAPASCSNRLLLSRPSDFKHRADGVPPRHTSGLHLGCACLSRDLQTVSFVVWVNGVNDSATSPPVEWSLGVDVDARSAKRRMAREIGLKRSSNNWGHLSLKQPWRIFSQRTRESVGYAPRGFFADSRAVDDWAQAADDTGASAVMPFTVVEGGQWMWPGVRRGFVQNATIATGLTNGESSSSTVMVQLETLALQPLVFRVRNFLRLEERDAIIALAQGKMGSSPVSHMDHDVGVAAKKWRTSTQAWLSAAESPTLIAPIDARVASLTGVDVSHQEAVQVLRYQPGEFYSSHLDAWDPQYYESQKENYDYGHKNRLATLFWYLTELPEGGGGETVFPRAFGGAQPHDMWSCKVGLKIRPEVREREEGESERERHSVKQKFTLLIPSHLRTLTPHLPHAGRRRGPLVQSSAQWQRGRKLTPRRLPSSRAGWINEVGCQQVDLEQAAELSRIKRMAYLYLITPYCDLSGNPSRSR